MKKITSNLILIIGLIFSSAKIGLIKWAPYLGGGIVVAQGYSTQGNNSDNSWSLFETNSPTSSYGNRRNVIQMNSTWFYHMNIRKLFIDTVMKKNYALSNVKMMWVDSSSGEVKTTKLSTFLATSAGTVSAGIGLISSMTGTTQTLKVDTVAIMPTAKALSAISVITSQVNTKLNISDTAGKWAPSGFYDRSNTNEIQLLSGSGTQTISLSSGGGSFVIPSQTLQIESDPVWTSDKTNYYTKSLSDARYLQSFTETDPIWSAASSNYYTKTQGDVRYLQSFSESDPLWSVSPSNTITNIQTGNWNTAFGWGDHASAGYVTASSVNAFTNKSGNISQWTNNSGYLTSEVDGSVSNEIQSLSINSNTLSISGGNSINLPVATFTAISAGAGISVTSNSVITNTSPDVIVGITAANTRIAVSGTYPNFVLTPYVPTSFTVTRPINSSTFQPSSTKQAFVFYTIRINCVATIGGAASATVSLQHSNDNGATWIDDGQVENSNTVTLAVVLNSNTTQTSQISAVIPVGAICRLVTANSGATITYIRGNETY